ncbi:MAG: precorrin-6A reductase [Oscillospiraceae bacterium]
MKENKLLLFAGTTEGRLLFENLSKHLIPIDVCVATEYGKELIQGNGDNIFAKRLNQDEMKSLILKNKYTLVIDATHPYATVVTQNIKTACEELNIEYMRLLRNESMCDDVIYCENIDEAVDFLRLHTGNVLSTIGSKELCHLTQVEGFEQRIFARILPLPDAVNACFSLGFHGSNLICMQGPFSYALNIAMLKQYQCSYLLTKNSGDVGGFEEKIQAAKSANAKVIVIGRPTKEVGLSLDEVTALLLKQESSQQKIKKELKTYFPLFINLANKLVLVVGGGKIATRRIQTLAKFQCKITVIAPKVTKEVEQLHKTGQIIYQQRMFEPSKLKGVFLVVAATNDRAVNHKISILAKEKGIYHSIADCKEECNFFFPAIIETKDTVIGLTAEGKSHKAASEMADKIRGITNAN